MWAAQNYDDPTVGIIWAINSKGNQRIPEDSGIYSDVVY